jgi:hypothetical protein
METFMIKAQRHSDTEVSIEKNGVKVVLDYDEAISTIAIWWDTLREDMNVANKVQEYRKKYTTRPL